jgi:branched-chain amino acid transport system substrate-binding protein
MRRAIAAVCCVLVLPIVLAACSDDDDGSGTAAGGGDSSAPIKVGAISSLSGPFTVPDVSKTAEAVFDEVNAAGGIDGRKIEYTVEDDAVDPAKAAQAARRLVDDEGVVALAGGGSILECSVNAKYYVANDVRSVMGVGVDPACFSSPNISPVSNGAFTAVGVNMLYASQELGHTRVCGIFNSVPGFAPGYEAAVKEWEELSGQKLALYLPTVQGDADLTPFVLRAKRAGCQAVVFNGTEQQIIAWVKAAEAQNVTGIDWVFTTGGYTNEVANALQDAPDLIISAEYAPYTDESDEALDGWRELIAEHDIPPSAFSQAGYLSANIMVDVLKGIDGAIDRESVGEALLALESLSTPFLGRPYSFGTAEVHNANRSAKYLRLEHGEWQLASPDWVDLPAL